MQLLYCQLTVRAAAVLQACYFSVAVVGFWEFGMSVRDNVLDNVGEPLWAISAAHAFVVLHVLSSYQVRTCPWVGSLILASPAPAPHPCPCCSGPHATSATAIHITPHPAPHLPLRLSASGLNYSSSANPPRP